MVTQGYLKYKYDIKIDLFELIDRIMGELNGYVDDYKFEFDGDMIVIHVKDSASYTRYRAAATLEEPAEDNIEFDSIESVDVTAAVLDALHDTDKIDVAVVVSNDYELEGE